MDKKLRVLIVEDDDPTRSAIVSYLNDAGIRCRTTPDGEDAVANVDPKHGFDAITLDLTLPDISGYDVIEQIRAKGYRIPILVLTEDASVKSKVKALELGADDYMTKPFHKDELVARLKAIYRSRQYGGKDTGEYVSSLLLESL